MSNWLDREFNAPVEHFAGKRIDAQFFDLKAIPYALTPLFLLIPFVGFLFAFLWAVFTLLFFSIIHAKGITTKALMRGFWVWFRRGRIYSSGIFNKKVSIFELF